MAYFFYCLGFWAHIIISPTSIYFFQAFLSRLAIQGASSMLIWGVAVPGPTPKDFRRGAGRDGPAFPAFSKPGNKLGREDKQTELLLGKLM